MKVCVIGTGYVGLTTGACLAYLGHDVTCVDIDEAKVELLRAGKSPIYEPYLEDLLDSGRTDHLTSPPTTPRACPGPTWCSSPSGRPRCPTAARTCAYLRRRPRRSAAPADGFTVVVNKSTVPIGSGNWVDALVRDAFERPPRAQPEARLCRSRRIRSFCAKAPRSATRCTRTGSSWARTTSAASRSSTRLYRPILEQSFTPPHLPGPPGRDQRRCRWSPPTSPRPS